MLPVLHRLLLGRFISLVLFSTGALLGLLLSTRFFEIARFAALGGIGWPLVTYTACQIPLILPIVFPIGAALASFFLFQEFSRSGGITSLRASALSFRKLLTPILLAALFFSFLNGLLISDISPLAKNKARQLQREWKGINPLALLKQKELLLASGIEVVPLGDADPALFAEKVITAVRQNKNDRLLLITADKLQRSDSALDGENLSAFLYGEKKKGEFSDLYIDKSKTFSTDIEPLTFVITKERSKPVPDHLSTPQFLKELIKKESIFDKRKLYSEAARRLMITLAPFTFTLLGAASGLMIGRKGSLKPQLILIGLTALFLAAFFLGKSFDTRIAVAIPCFLAPHLFLVIAALKRLNRLKMGIE